MTFSRRDFLKFSAMLTASSLIRPGFEIYPTRLSTDPNAKNVLIIVFDCFSGKNVNFYGYPRETMPNLTRLLDRATVFHNHYASANFTAPGTASLLTGRQVWEHLALKNPGTVKNGFDTENVFSFFDDYYKIAYSHNYMADTLLAQFGEEISHHEFYKTQYLEYQSGNSIQWFDKLLRNEPDTAQLFKSLLSDSGIEGYLYALLFPSLLGDSSFEIPPELLAQFPNGVPTAHGTDPFILEDAIQWTADQVSTLPQPFLGYFHYLPPHGSYRTRIDFFDTFLDDGYAHVRKPIHPAVLANKTPINYETEQNVIRLYDEYILYVDSEFNRLFNILDQQGALENTLLVFTSDHGEVIERGTNGHMLPYLYEPVIKVPLVIFEPGQTERRDVYSRTSAVDILPTVLHYTGHTVPTELPGQVLPTFSDSPIDTSRTLYTLYARENPNAANLAVATLAMIRENMKVIQYHGYSTSRHNLNLGKQYGVTLSDIDPYYEVYDLENDPEEMNNLALNPTSEIRELIEEIEQFYVDNIEYPNIREEDR